MTAVAEVDRDPEAPVTPTEDQLLDVLYEVLAQGVPLRSSLTREELERFLHEHARDSKPIAEMLLFFEKHKLPLDANQYGADPELGELASGLQKERTSVMPSYVPPDLTAVAPPPAAATSITGSFAAVEAPLGAASAAPIQDETTARRKAALTPTVPGAAAAELAPAAGSSAGQGGSPRLRWLVVSVVVVGLGLGAALLASHQRASSLEARLEQARMQQRSTDVALSKLEQRAESLQGALQQSEADRRTLSTRLESEIAEETKQRAAEEQALEKLLGPRYRAMRLKLASEGASGSSPGAAAPSGSAAPGRPGAAPPPARPSVPAAQAAGAAGVSPATN